MTGPVPRPMREEDLPAVMRLDAESMARPWSEAVWREELRSPFGHYLVLEDEKTGITREIEPENAARDPDSISGHVGVKHVADELHVMTLAVSPGRRRQGYARALLGAALAAFPDARRVYLEVRPSNAAARALYGSLGFETTGLRRGYYGDEDALLMALEPGERGLPSRVRRY